MAQLMVTSKQINDAMTIYLSAHLQYWHKLTYSSTAQHNANPNTKHLKLTHNATVAAS